MIYIKIICCHKTHKIYNNYSNGNATMYLGVYGYLEVDDITKNVLKSNGKAMTCMGEIGNYQIMESLLMDLDIMKIMYLWIAIE